MEGEIKRTGVRWLPSVAKACLHIGFCKLKRHYFGTSQGVRVPPFEFSFWISNVRAMALAMCVDEEPRCLRAIARVDAM